MVSYPGSSSDDEAAASPFDRSSLQASLAEALAAAAGSFVGEPEANAGDDRPGEGLEVQPLSVVGGAAPPAAPERHGTTGEAGEALDELDALVLRGWGRPTAQRGGPGLAREEDPTGAPDGDGRRGLDDRAEQPAKLPPAVKPPQTAKLPPPVRPFAPIDRSATAGRHQPTGASGTGSGNWFEVDGWASGEQWQNGDPSGHLGSGPGDLGSGPGDLGSGPGHLGSGPGDLGSGALSAPAPITRRGPSLSSLSPETAALLGASAPSGPGNNGSYPNDPGASGSDGASAGAGTTGARKAKAAAATPDAGALVPGAGTDRDDRGAATGTGSPAPGVGTPGEQPGLEGIEVHPGILAEAPGSGPGLDAVGDSALATVTLPPAGGDRPGETDRSRPPGDRADDLSGPGPSQTAALARWSPEQDDILPSRSILNRPIPLRLHRGASEDGGSKAIRRRRERPEPGGTDPAPSGRRAGSRLGTRGGPGNPTLPGGPGRAAAEASPPVGGRKRRDGGLRSPAGADEPRAGRPGSEAKRRGSTGVLNRPLGELFKKSR